MTPLLEQKVRELIVGAKHILLMTDERLDGDTLGSSLGIFHVLKEMGKEVTIYSPKPIPANLKFIPGTEFIRFDELAYMQPSIDLSIVCDCSDGMYLKNVLPKMPRKIPLVSFDHHKTNPRYGTYNFVEEHAASTADVVWRFVKRAGFPVPAKAATAFLTGICTDTSLFSTSNTTTEAFEASVELTKRGARMHDIVRHTMLNRPVPILKVWGLLFERLHYNEEFDALTTALTQNDLAELGNPEVDTSSISNFLNATLDHAETILILRESDDGGVKGSLRSRGRDVAELAEKYGGGGHKLASGFKIANARLAERNGKWVIERSTPSVQPAKNSDLTDEQVNVNFLKA